MKKILKMFIIFLAFTFIYILTFHLGIKIPIYTYYGITSLFVLTILLIIILIIYTKKSSNFDIKDSVIVILLCFFINLYFFCMVPVTLERSISVFMLNKMKNEKSYTKKEIEEMFIDKYVYEYKAFDKRLNEQEYTGTIEKKDKEYKINKKGKRLVKVFSLIKKIYNIKGKIIE